jgi:3-phosphoshikimate 1-carboxyvinyltransferase
MAFIVAALITPESSLLLRGVGLNPTRKGALHILQAMGGNIKVITENGKESSEKSIEPTADLLVESSRLTGVEIGGSIIPRLIDEIPLLAIAASQAQGVTQIKDAGELRVKESDRLKSVADGLKHLGAQVGETPDGLLIVGPSPLQGGRCSSHGDHRIAMAFAVAGLIAQGETVIDEADTVEVSYPAFFDHLKTLVTKD